MRIAPGQSKLSIPSHRSVLNSNMHIHTYLQSIDIYSRTVLTNFMWSDIFSFHYVCTYIFIYVCTYPSLFTHTCTYMFIHIYMHRYARIHISNQFHCYNVFSYCAGQVIHFDMNMATLPAASLDIRCIEIKQVQQVSTTNIIQIDIAMMMLKK